MIKVDKIVYCYYHQEHSGFGSKFASIMSQNGNIQDEEIAVNVMIEYLKWFR